MAYTTLIATKELAQHLNDPDWAVIDCRFSLDRPERGRSDYLQAHIPGAVYAHLNEDLCAPVMPGQTGRHPLPSIEHAARRFMNWGIDEDVQVVVYDDWPGASGAIAARLWWMLRWLGHEAVAVLDGGWERWREEGRPVRDGNECRVPRNFIPEEQPDLLVRAGEVDAMRQDAHSRVFDSRARERYRGEREPIDPRAGHIPGAYPAPYAENVGQDGRFLPVDELRQRFERLLDGRTAGRPQRVLLWLRRDRRTQPGGDGARWIGGRETICGIVE